MDSLHIQTVEMHTGGEPLRILKSGLPEVHGATLLDKFKYCLENIDHVRKFLMQEPRGHKDMFGVYLVQPDIEEAALACIFINSGGYSTMCGHVTIALGRYAVDRGLIRAPTSPVTRFLLQCPCGPVEVLVDYKDGKAGAVAFCSVPSFLNAKDLEAEVPGFGTVTFDIAYGGAFYAIVPASRVGVNLDTASAQEIRHAAGNLTDVIRGSLKLTHPDSPDLAVLHGTILIDGNDVAGKSENAQVCVFGERQVDRSPCGSGTTARAAQLFFRGQLKLNEARDFRGPTGSTFKATVVKEVKYGPHDAVVVEVSSKGFYSGECEFVLEADDTIGNGFLLR
ncbi:trans-L-3-hydroxyproline dehydratase-like [Mya arenaria]|uniref:trans-L-3-hydroxyproline dehydratase-like n=1 Tax=Mya arenaria TaxID=6604 RepID=UPI0022DFDF3B|nr:trans-L-3-hydroxyproline dehydratase-like [Mya arenaria]